MNKRIVLKEFTVEAEIFDVDLPAKVAKVLTSDRFAPEPDLYYDVDIVFDKGVYKKAEFYQYPIPEKKMPKDTSRRYSEQDRIKDIIYAVLSSQLDATKKAITDLGFLIGSATIIGDVHDTGVTVVIYESEKPEPVKGRKKPTQIHVNSIMPDRPFLQERMAKLLADMVLQQIREDDLKEIKRKAHTPNWISADAMFAAVSTACIPDNAEKAQALKSKLLKDAEMKSDWPLHICSKTDKNTESTIDDSTSLDCSDYMLFQRYQGGRWELKSITDLKDAKRIITKDGFNRKQTEAIIVLHDLEPVPYTLHTETEDGLRPVSAEEARGNKKLFVSWI